MLCLRTFLWDVKRPENRWAHRPGSLGFTPGIERARDTSPTRKRNRAIREFAEGRSFVPDGIEALKPRGRTLKSDIGCQRQRLSFIVEAGAPILALK